MKIGVLKTILESFSKDEQIINKKVSIHFKDQKEIEFYGFQPEIIENTILFISDLENVYYFDIENISYIKKESLSLSSIQEHFRKDLRGLFTHREDFNLGADIFQERSFNPVIDLKNSKLTIYCSETVKNFIINNQLLEKVQRMTQYLVEGKINSNFENYNIVFKESKLNK